MDRWILVAIERNTARGLAELLIQHLEEVWPHDEEVALAEFIIGAYLIQDLVPATAQPELREYAQQMTNALRGMSRLSPSETRPRSRRLIWPRDSAWIEAQWSAGKLDQAPPDDAAASD